MNVFAIHAINFNIASAVSLILNGAILYLILVRSILGTKTYNGILITSTVVNILYSLCLFYVKPWAILHDGTTYMILPKSESTALQLSYLVIGSTWTALLYMNLIITANGFIYRYRHICMGTEYTFRYGLVSNVLSVALASLISIAILLCCYTIDPVVLAERSRVIMSMIGGRHNEDMKIAGASLDNTVNAYVMLTIGVLPSPIAYFLIFYTYFKVRSYLRQNEKSFTKKTLSLHRQYTKVVIMQALMPFVSFVVPMAFLVCLNFTNNMDTVIMSILGLQGLAWIPAGNAVTVLFSVKPLYRYIFCSTCKSRPPQNRAPTKTANTTTISRPYVVRAPPPRRGPLFAGHSSVGERK